jgi:uncharacterized membrane protein YsdA (DUF1294 family)
MLIPAIISVLIALPLSILWVYLLDKNKKDDDV